VTPGSGASFAGVGNVLLSLAATRDNAPRDENAARACAGSALGASRAASAPCGDGVIDPAAARAAPSAVALLSSACIGSAVAASVRCAGSVIAAGIAAAAAAVPRDEIGTTSAGWCASAARFSVATIVTAVGATGGIASGSGSMSIGSMVGAGASALAVSLAGAAASRGAAAS
jgi:hypothetical protein